MIKKILLSCFLIVIAFSACQDSNNTWVMGDLTKEQIQVLLDKHNTLRQEVASGSLSGFSGATDMLKVYWDASLATRSQELADLCEFSHSQDNNRGENIATQSSSGTLDLTDDILEDMVQRWYDEYQFYDPSTVNSFANNPTTVGEQVGHFTQVVWAKSEAIGCGIAKYSNAQWANNFILFCQYTEQGNFLSQPIYIEKANSNDASCTACPQGYTCDTDYSALCSSSSKSYVAPEPVNPNGDDDTKDDSQFLLQPVLALLLIALSTLL